MQKSLAISATTSVNGKYPLPDNGVSVLSGGVLINTQGYAGKTTLANIKFNGAGLDPLDGQYYTYSTNKTQTGFALMAYLENASNLTLVSYLPSFQRASAATVDYSTRYPAVTGNPIGILLASGTNIPLQASTSTGIELTTNTAVYAAYIAPKVVITSLGTILVAAITTAWAGMSSTGMYVTNGACMGIPANAVYSNSGSSYTLVNAPYNTTLNAYYSATPLTSTCQYTCASGYSWNGSACLVATVSGACTGIPSNAVYYNGTASYSLVGAANGTSLTASNMTGAIIINTCQFNCSGGYSWNGSACIVNTPTVVCSGAGVTQISHKCTFNYAGSIQMLTVSGAAGTLSLTAWGAGGSSQCGYGGGGAAGTLSLPMNPGDALAIYTAQGGGWAGGGGGTYILKSSVPVLVTGGGGGIDGCATAGAGVWYAGGSTSNGSNAGSWGLGWGGFSTLGTLIWCGGSYGGGGEGCNTGYSGGGGGYSGGNGGGGGGGLGGSSYASNGTSSGTLYPGSGATPGGTGLTGYVAGIGVGNTNYVQGGNGMVIVTW